MSFTFWWQRWNTPVCDTVGYSCSCIVVGYSSLCYLTVILCCIDICNLIFVLLYIVYICISFKAELLAGEVVCAGVSPLVYFWVIITGSSCESPLLLVLGVR